MDSELFYNYKVNRSPGGFIVFICRNCWFNIEFPNPRDDYIMLYDKDYKKTVRRLSMEEILQLHLMECEKFQEIIDKRRKWEEEMEIKSRL